MRTRLLLLPLLLASLLVSGAHAERAPLIVDPRGDHAVPDGDILAADLTTVRAGRSGKLVIELELASPPSTTAPYAYSVNFQIGGCRFSAIYYAYPLSTSAVGCRDESGSSAALRPGQVDITGSTITWVVPLGGPVRFGALASRIDARTTPTGTTSGGWMDDLGDRAVAHSKYRIGD